MNKIKRIIIDYIDDEHFTSEIGRDLLFMRNKKGDNKNGINVNARCFKFNRKI